MRITTATARAGALTTSLWLALVLAATLLAAAPAGAQEPTFAFEPSSGPPGTTISFSGRCDEPSAGTEVEVTFVHVEPPPDYRYTVTTDATGAFGGRIVVPANLWARTYDVAAFCRHTGGVSQHGGTFAVTAGCRPAATSWGSWGGVVDSGVSATVDGEDRLTAFAVAGGGNLYRRAAALGALGSWQNLGRPAGLTLSGTPGSATWHGGSAVSVFARASDGAVWHTYRQDGSWSPWSSIGGIVDSGVAVAEQGSRVNVFAIADGRLYQRTYSTHARPHVQRGWSPWRNLGSPSGTTLTDDAPAAIDYSTGFVVVFARGADGAIWHRSIHPTGNVSDWISLGGVLATGPAAVDDARGQIHVYAVAPNGALYRRTRSGSGTWNGWTFEDGWGRWTYQDAPFGTALAAQPGAAIWPVDGHVSTLTPSADGAVWYGNQRCVVN